MKVNIGMTKQPKKSVQQKKTFLTKLVQNASNPSKPSAKQPQHPKCTKTENQSKTLKEAKTIGKCLNMIFMTKNTFSTKKFPKRFKSKKLVV